MSKLLKACTFERGEMGASTSWCVLMSSKKVRAPLFKLGVLSDIHLTTLPDIPPRMHSRSGYLATEMVKRFNQQKVDFLLFPGDLTDKGLPGELALALSVLKTAKVKTLFTHGNHDRINDENREFWKKYLLAR